MAPEWCDDARSSEGGVHRIAFEGSNNLDDVGGIEIRQIPLLRAAPSWADHGLIRRKFVGFAGFGRRGEPQSQFGNHHRGATLLQILRESEILAECEGDRGTVTQVILHSGSVALFAACDPNRCPNG